MDQPIKPFLEARKAKVPAPPFKPGTAERGSKLSVLHETNDPIDDPRPIGSRYIETRHAIQVDFLRGVFDRSQYWDTLPHCFCKDQTEALDVTEHRERGCTSPHRFDLRIRQEAENFDSGSSGRSTRHLNKFWKMCPAAGKDQFRVWDFRNHIRPSVDENILTFGKEIVRSSKK